jgi:hypothetical protein
MTNTLKQTAKELVTLCEDIYGDQPYEQVGAIREAYVRSAGLTAEEASKLEREFALLGYL